MLVPWAANERVRSGAPAARTAHNGWLREQLAVTADALRSKVCISNCSSSDAFFSVSCELLRCGLQRLASGSLP